MSERLSLAKQVSDVWTNLSQLAEEGDLERLIAAAERIAEALEQIAATSERDDNATRAETSSPERPAEGFRNRIQNFLRRGASLELAVHTVRREMENEQARVITELSILGAQLSWTPTPVSPMPPPVENPATQTLGGRLLIDRVRMRREHTDENLACAVRVCRAWMNTETAVGSPLPTPPTFPRDTQHRIELDELTLAWQEPMGWILMAAPPGVGGRIPRDPSIWTAPVDQSNGSDPDERPAEGGAPSNERDIPF